MYEDIQFDVARMIHKVIFVGQHHGSLSALHAAEMRCDLARCFALANINLLALAAIDGLLQDRVGMLPACSCAFSRRCNLSRLQASSSG